MTLWQFKGYKRDKDLDRDHERGKHAEKLFFGCHWCTELLSEYESRIAEERATFDMDAVADEQYPDD